jgi:HEAT repeat protein
MPIQITCPNGHRLQVKDQFAGKKARCPKCSATVVVPVIQRPPALAEDPGYEVVNDDAAPAVSQPLVMGRLIEASPQELLRLARNAGARERAVLLPEAVDERGKWLWIGLSSSVSFIVVMIIGILLILHSRGQAKQESTTSAPASQLAPSSDDRAADSYAAAHEPDPTVITQLKEASQKETSPPASPPAAPGATQSPAASPQSPPVSSQSPPVSPPSTVTRTGQDRQGDLLRDLESNDETRRRKATNELLKLRAKLGSATGELDKSLAQLLKSNFEETVGSTLSVLNDGCSDECLAAVGDVLRKHPSPKIRKHALVVLGKTHLDSASPETKHELSEALGDALADPDVSVVNDVLDRLVEWQEKITVSGASLARMLETHKSVSKKALLLFASAPLDESELVRTRITQYLIEVLSARDFDSKLAALGAITKWGDQSCVPALVDLLLDTPSFFELSERTPFESFRTVETAYQLGNVLADSTDAKLTRVTARIMGRMGVVAEAPLVSALDGADTYKLACVCAALAELELPEGPSQKTITKLIGIFRNSTEYDAKTLALKAIGRLRNRRTVEALLNQFSGPDLASVKQALVDIGPVGEPALLNELKTDDRTESAGVILQVLEKIGTSTSIWALEAIADKKGPNATRARRAIDAIQRRKK